MLTRTARITSPRRMPPELGSRGPFSARPRPARLTSVEQTTATDREMNLRFAGVCTVCGDEIPKGSRAVYSPSSRSVHHTACPGLERGDAGSSARREFERRKARDDARIEARKADVRATFGDGFIGKVATFLAVDDSPRRSTSVWAQGAVG